MPKFLLCTFSSPIFSLRDFFPFSESSLRAHDYSGKGNNHGSFCHILWNSEFIFKSTHSPRPLDNHLHISADFNPFPTRFARWLQFSRLVWMVIIIPALVTASRRTKERIVYHGKTWGHLTFEITNCLVCIIELVILTGIKVSQLVKKRMDDPARMCDHFATVFSCELRFKTRPSLEHRYRSKLNYSLNPACLISRPV